MPSVVPCLRLRHLHQLHVTSYSVGCGYALSQQQRQVSLGGWSASGSSLSSASFTAERLVVRCCIVSVLNQVAKNGVWPDLAWDDIAQFFPHLVGKRLLLAFACLASSSLDFLSRWLCLSLLVMLTCTSTCEMLIGFIDRSQLL